MGLFLYIKSLMCEEILLCLIIGTIKQEPLINALNQRLETII